VSRIAFIPIASPKLRSAPPTGPDWLHEIKFDGFRIQLHKSGNEVRLFSRNGKDFTSRFPSIAEAVGRLPTRSAVIDGELVACDAEGKPDFYALMRRYTHGLCVWCFDLLVLGGSDLRPLPFEERKIKLEALLAKANDDRLMYSLSFDDGKVLLEAAARLNLQQETRSTVRRREQFRLDQGEDGCLARGQPRALQAVREGVISG
jgi:bifunctional non-homologous end joining protein LigD